MASSTGIKNEKSNSIQIFTNKDINWVEYNEDLVSTRPNTSEFNMPESAFGADFIVRWARILEDKRQAAEELKDAGRWRGSATILLRVKKPVTPKRLAKKLEPLAFFAPSLATMSEPETDGVLQLSEIQLKCAKKHLSKAKKAFDAYLGYRQRLSDQDGNSRLPHGDSVSIALSMIEKSLDETVTRGRSRKQYLIIVGELRNIISELTGTIGRSVDRSSDNESGLLYQFSFEFVLSIAPDHHKGKLMSRIKSAVRQSRDQRL